MTDGIALISAVPVRLEPSSKSELRSQLLFGETYDMLEEKGDWFRIRTHFDNYEGWINNTQFAVNSTSNREAVTLSVFPVLSANAEGEPGQHLIYCGSSIYNAEQSGEYLHFNVGGRSFRAILPDKKLEFISQAEIPSLALKYMHSPYLWGGRSPFGIDCSGLTQIAYKCAGIKLQRDSHMQAEQGSTVGFIDEAKPGDLAFFDNAEGKIIHVGIILGDGKIIHASGSVRVDDIDSFGIMNREKKKYSHKLRIVKRIV